MVNLTDAQVKEVSTLLLDLDVMLISIRNIAPAVETDVMIDGGLKNGVAWDKVVSALAVQGQQAVAKVLETISP